MVDYVMLAAPLGVFGAIAGCNGNTRARYSCFYANYFFLYLLLVFYYYGFF
jgi:Na+/H+-dicarboxylate symporter